jgi:hypothetical protein
VDDRITRLRNQATELDQLTRRQHFTNIYVQFIAKASK